MTDQSLTEQPHVMIVVARFYPDIADELTRGATAVLDAAGASHEVFEVPGAFEIPAAVAIAVRSMDHFAGRRRFDGYVALGCVIRGETSHYDHVAEGAMMGLQTVAQRYALALGTGILTVENRAQAEARAGLGGGNKGGNKGGSAAQTCLRMIGLKTEFHMFPR